MNLENKAHVRESQIVVTMIQDHFISPDGLKSHHVKRGAQNLANSLFRDCLAVKGKVNEKKLPEPRKAHDIVAAHFRPKRHLLSAADYQAERQRRLETWQQIIAA